MSRARMRDYMTGLVKAGILSVAYGARVGLPATYTLARDCGVCAPRVRKDGALLPDSGRTRMWQAMHILGTFSVRELAAAASLQDAPVAYSEAETYCRWLCRGGYLQQIGKLAWRAIPARHTGPKAPQILRVKQLYDPNTARVVLSNDPEGRDDL